MLIFGYGEAESGQGYDWREHLDSLPTRGALIDLLTSHIDHQTDERILTGFRWKPAGSADSVAVWLSRENQINFSEAQRAAMMADGQGRAYEPVTFKIWEDGEKRPVYHTFETLGELTRFYFEGVAYIQGVLSEGWAEKDHARVWVDSLGLSEE